MVGPHGAGKSTFVELILQPHLPADTVFVNADEIAKQQWPADPEAKSYAAAQIAAKTRSALIAAGRPLIAETVFSHPSKLDLIAEAQGAGFWVELHVLMVPEDLAVARVKYRVASGGHSVPEDKIRHRYRRLWTLMAQAMESCDRATVYDNSSNDGPVTVAQLTHGVAVGQLNWPDWAPAELTSRAW